MVQVLVVLVLLVVVVQVHVLVLVQMLLLVPVQMLLLHLVPPIGGRPITRCSPLSSRAHRRRVTCSHTACCCCASSPKTPLGTLTPIFHMCAPQHFPLSMTRFFLLTLTTRPLLEMLARTTEIPMEAAVEVNTPPHTPPHSSPDHSRTLDHITDLRLTFHDPHAPTASSK